MIGNWIAWTKGLPSRLEVIQIATVMETSRYEAACHCMAVWEWADANTDDGYIDGISPEMISQVVNVPGIGEAMEGVGWIIRQIEGITLPNWDRYNTRSAKARMKCRERMRRYRKRNPV